MPIVMQYLDPLLFTLLPFYADHCLTMMDNWLFVRDHQQVASSLQSWGHEDTGLRTSARIVVIEIGFVRSNICTQSNQLPLSVWWNFYQKILSDTFMYIFNIWMDTKFIRRFREFEFLYKSNYTFISPWSPDRNPSLSPLLKISQ